MGYHIHKDEIQLQWLDNRDTVKRELANLTRRIENEVFRVLDDEFTKGVKKGELLKVKPGSEEMIKLYAESMLEALDYVPEEKPDQLQIEVGDV